MSNQTSSSSGPPSQPSAPLEFRLSWAEPDQPPIHLLMAWLAEQFQPVGHVTDEALRLDEVAGPSRSVGFRLPLEYSNSEPPTCEALASALQVGSVSGMWPGTCQPILRVDGEVVAQLELQLAPLQVSVRLDPRLLRWPHFLSGLQRWLLLMELSWPAEQLLISPELDRTAPLTPREVSLAVALLSAQLFGAACARYQGRTFSPGREQSVRGKVDLLVQIGERLRGTHLGGGQVIMQISEGIWDGQLATGQAKSSPSLRFAKVIAAEKEPIRESGHQALMLGEDKNRLFKMALQALWAESCDPPLHAGGGVAIKLSELESVLSERNFVQFSSINGHDLSILSWEPRVSLGASPTELLSLMRQLAPELPLQAVALSLEGCPGDIKSCPRLHPDLPPPSLGFVLKGPGHDLFQSRRLLEHGPWRLTRLANDTSLVQLHPLNLPYREALRQAAEGQRWMAAALLPASPELPARCPVYHDAVAGLLWLEAPDEPLSPEELGHLIGVARSMATDPATPVSRVAALFRDEAAANAQLPILWLREIEVWSLGEAGWTRVGHDLEPSFIKPEWISLDDVLDEALVSP